MAGTIVGALVGAAAGYLFFTERGRELREQMEPAMDDLQREFGRFQSTIDRLGGMANEGMKMVHEFNTARSDAYGTTRTSH